MQSSSTNEPVETIQLAGAWVVRVGSMIVEEFPVRGLAVEAGALLAIALGLSHVIRYASTKPAVV